MASQWVLRGGVRERTFSLFSNLGAPLETHRAPRGPPEAPRKLPRGNLESFLLQFSHIFDPLWLNFSEHFGFDCHMFFHSSKQTNKQTNKHTHSQRAFLSSGQQANNLHSKRAFLSSGQQASNLTAKGHKAPTAKANAFQKALTKNRSFS